MKINDIIFVIKSDRPQIDASLASLKNIFNQLNSVNSEIQKYHNHEKDILFNSQIESEIDNLQNQSDNLDYQLDTDSN